MYLNGLKNVPSRILMSTGMLLRMFEYIILAVIVLLRMRKSPQNSAQQSTEDFSNIRRYQYYPGLYSNFQEYPPYPPKSDTSNE